MAIIAHLAIYCTDLDSMKDFYMKYFNARPNELYSNAKNGFNSYFLSFGESPMRLELMTKVSVTKGGEITHTERIGITHFAIEVGSVEKVDEFTNILRKDGYSIIGEPRRTGDGYYESIILDPEGNRLELVA